MTGAATAGERRSPDRLRGGTPDREVRGAAWAATLLVSALPAIVGAELLGGVPSWLWIAQLAIAVGLVVAALLVTRLRSLWRFGAVLAGLILLVRASALVDLGGAPLFGGTALDQRMQSEQVVKLAVAALMVALLLTIGLRRRSLFLAVGSLRAPITPVRWLGFPRPESWVKFGLIWGLGIATALVVVQWLLIRPEPADWAGVVPMIPGILVYATFNALSEEVTYRLPMLATLEPVVGPVSALWQSAALFGLAHYFGIPGGVFGAVVSIFMGWILGKAILETRGLLWAWFIHFLADVAIFTFLAVQLVR